MLLKKIVKKLLEYSPVSVTQNQRYDRQTKAVIKRVCTATSGCIDIGAHKGEVLDIIRHFAPQGIHHAFEPIPDLYEKLVKKYAAVANCQVHNYALSNVSGTATFNYVISNPAYSGLVKRKYDRKDEVDTTIEVKTELLDNILPAGYVPALIKIDVEGGEMQVLEGAKALITRAKPVIVFEHGLGASDFYGSTPEKLYDLLAGCGMKISTMKRWLKKQTALERAQFCEHYYQQKEFYFIAYA